MEVYVWPPDLHPRSPYQWSAKTFNTSIFLCWPGFVWIQQLLFSSRQIEHHTGMWTSHHFSNTKRRKSAAQTPLKTVCFYWLCTLVLEMTNSVFRCRSVTWWAPARTTGWGRPGSPETERGGSTSRSSSLWETATACPECWAPAR